MELIALVVWSQVRTYGGNYPGGYPTGPSAGGSMGSAAGACCCPLLMLIAFVPAIIGVWKAFEKAGEPGWTSIVPFYNMMVMARIAGRSEMDGLLTLIPCVGIIFAILIIIDFCKQFNVGGGFVAGIILLPYVFWPMLGFGSYQYRGGRPGGRRRVVAEEEEEERPRRRRRDEDEDEGDDRIRRRRPRDEE